MKEKRVLKFVYTKEFNGEKYNAGDIAELELLPHEFDRLTRSGCIYASKEAKLEEKKEEKEPVEKKVSKKKASKKTTKKELDNVDNKELDEQAEVQAD